jgi:hypothetical protein
MPRDLIVARAEDFAALKAETSFAVLLQEVQVVSAVLVFNAVRFSMLLEHLVRSRTAFGPLTLLTAFRTLVEVLFARTTDIWRVRVWKCTSCPHQFRRFESDWTGIGDGDREVVDSFI